MHEHRQTTRRYISAPGSTRCVPSLLITTECRYNQLVAVASSSSSSSQNPAESSAHNASVPDELWAQRDQPALEDIK